MEDDGHTVSGYVQGQQGQQFEVGLYDGRGKKSGVKGYTATLYFGSEQYVPCAPLPRSTAR